MAVKRFLLHPKANLTAATFVNINRLDASHKGAQPDATMEVSE